MRKIVLILAIMLLQACVTIPEGYISQEEADRQKHAYLCTTNEWLSHDRWDYIPHCVNGSINQQQAVALVEWLTRYNGFYVIRANDQSEKNKYHQYYEHNYKIIQQLKPYLYAGDYYFYLSDVARDLWHYYDRDGDDAEKAEIWKKRFEEAKAKQIKVGGGLSNHWARSEYSNEKKNELLVSAAIRGNPSAQKILGQQYLNDESGFKKNKELGIAWIEQSARREPNSLDFNQLQKFKKYFSSNDYRYWQIMYLLSTNKGDDSRFDDFDGDLLKRLMGEVTDWEHFCDKYQKQRWLIIPEGGIIPEKYEALQTIIVQCVTQYPPAEQPYINDLRAD